MEYIKSNNFKLKRPSAVTMGKFDGLHRGHQKLLERVQEYAREGCKSVIFTFNMPPKSVLSGSPAQVLLTNEERREMLHARGIDFLIECPFLPELAQMAPEQFVSQVLSKQMHAAHIVVGSDFKFGHNRRGNVGLLKEMASDYHYSLDVIEKIKEGGREISSTRIKKELLLGNMSKVNELLGYSYLMIGEVCHGRKMGRTVLGVPTANLRPSVLKLLPPNGVYLSKTIIDGQEYPGITNIGFKPTIGEAFRGAETYLFNYDEDLYGKTIGVKLIKYQRPEVKFDSLEQLKFHLRQDIQEGIIHFS